MYQIIYEFILNNIFNYSALNSFESQVMGQTINLNVYLSHTATISFMILLLICFICFLRFLFKVVSGFILLK